MSAKSDFVQQFGSPTPAFQPIVDLRTGTVVAHEALSRWPSKSENSPEAVFAVARSLGMADELDQLCVSAAVTEAARNTPGTDDSKTLFVNIEPDTISSGDAAAAHHIGTLLRAGGPRVRPVAEFAERSLLTDPARLLRAADQLRRVGIMIALDDIGANPDSLVLLPLLCPDVIKLDRSLLDEHLSVQKLTTLLAVLAYSNRFEVALVAEGIETDRQREKAISWGATYGQGFHLGLPGRLTTNSTFFPARPRRAVPVPIGDVLDGHATDTASMSLLSEMSDHLLDFVLTTTESLTILTAFRDPTMCNEAVAHKLRSLADKHPYVKVFGAPRELFSTTDHVRHATLLQLSQGIAAIAIIGQRFYFALVARPVDLAAPFGQWTYFLTVEPTEVCSVAHTLIVHSRSFRRPVT